MNRWLALALVAAMLALPAASAASSSWTQEGYNAARTGDTPGSGPAWNDTAFRVRLPGTPGGGVTGAPSEPLVVDENAYIAVTPSSTAEELDGQGVARVNLTTADVEMFVSTDVAPQSLAIAEGRLFVVHERGLQAYDLATGEQIWSEDYPSQVPNHEEGFCLAPAIRNGIIYVPCTEIGGAQDQWVPQTSPFIWAVDTSTGGDEHESIQVLDRSTEAEDRPVPSQEDAYTRTVRFVAGVSVVGSHAFAFTLDTTHQNANRDTDEAGLYADTEEFRYTLWALDAEYLQVEWTNSTEPRRQARVAASGPAGVNEDRRVEDAFLPISPRITGTEEVVYQKVLGEVRAINPARQSEVWAESLGSKDTRTSQGGTHSAFTGEALYAASAQSLYRFDVDGPVRDWVFSLDPRSGEQFSWGSLVAADERVYAVTVDGGDHAAVYAVDADSGTQVWREEFRPEGDFGTAAHSFSLGSDVLVVTGRDGWVHVLGDTPASLGAPELGVSTDYPDVGEEVQVDLSDTQAGAFGNATRYKAIWGDGQATAWQVDPVLNHSYEDAGNVTARFLVANDANQTASTTHTFHVGQEEPVEPNWIEERFEKDNQDMTFGVLGVAIALGGGAIGVARRKRKKSILQEELETLEQGFEDTKDAPGECEAFLETRKARARSLMMDGTLDEEQFGIIESRVEELGRKLRTSMLDERFQFLPYGLVQSLKKMLADGKISSWERDAVDTLLEDEDALSEAQREKVRHQLDRWLVEDAGGGAA